VAIDNNLTRHIAASDPVAIAMIKGLAAGAVNLGLGLAIAAAPAAEFVAGALALGAASYGASLVLFIVALRHLGSARTGAHFATSPFIGAGVAIGLLGEPLTGTFAASLALMVGATWLLLTETHGHHHRTSRPSISTHTRTTSTTRMRTRAPRARRPTRIGTCTSRSRIHTRICPTCTTVIRIDPAGGAGQKGSILKFHSLSANQTSATARTTAEPPDMTSMR